MRISSAQGGPRRNSINRRLPNEEPQNFEVNAAPARALAFMIRASSFVNLRLAELRFAEFTPGEP